MRAYTAHRQQPDRDTGILATKAKPRLKDVLGAVSQEGARLVDALRIIPDVGTKVVFQADEILYLPEPATVAKPN